MQSRDQREVLIAAKVRYNLLNKFTKNPDKEGLTNELERARGLLAEYKRDSKQSIDFSTFNEKVDKATSEKFHKKVEHQEALFKILPIEIIDYINDPIRVPLEEKGYAKYEEERVKNFANLIINIMNGEQQDVQRDKVIRAFQGIGQSEESADKFIAKLAEVQAQNKKFQQEMQELEMIYPGIKHSYALFKMNPTESNKPFSDEQKNNLIEHHRKLIRGKLSELFSKLQDAIKYSEDLYFHSNLIRQHATLIRNLPPEEAKAHTQKLKTILEPHYEKIKINTVIRELNRQFESANKLLKNSNLSVPQRKQLQSFVDAYPKLITNIKAKPNQWKSLVSKLSYTVTDQGHVKGIESLIENRIANEKEVVENIINQPSMLIGGKRIFPEDDIFTEKDEFSPTILTPIILLRMQALNLQDTEEFRALKSAYYSNASLQEQQKAFANAQRQINHKLHDNSAEHANPVWYQSKWEEADKLAWHVKQLREQYENPIKFEKELRYLLSIRIEILKHIDASSIKSEGGTEKALAKLKKLIDSIDFNAPTPEQRNELKKQIEDLFQTRSGQLYLSDNQLTKIITSLQSTKNNTALMSESVEMTPIYQAKHQYSKIRQNPSSTVARGERLSTMVNNTYQPSVKPIVSRHAPNYQAAVDKVKKNRSEHNCDIEYKFLGNNQHQIDFKSKDEKNVLQKSHCNIGVEHRMEMHGDDINAFKALLLIFKECNPDHFPEIKCNESTRDQWIKAVDNVYKQELSINPEARDNIVKLENNLTAVPAKLTG